MSRFAAMGLLDVATGVLRLKPRRVDDGMLSSREEGGEAIGRVSALYTSSTTGQSLPADCSRRVL